jgi:hypothetical protein
MPEKNGETVLYPGKVDPHHLRVPRLNALVHKPITVVLAIICKKMARNEADSNMG